MRPWQVGSFLYWRTSGLVGGQGRYTLDLNSYAID